MGELQAAIRKSQGLLFIARRRIDGGLVEFFSLWLEVGSGRDKTEQGGRHGMIYTSMLIYVAPGLFAFLFID